MSNFQRLPRTVLPTLYKIQIDPDLVNFTFSGNVDIFSDIKEPLNVVKLNSVDLDITSAHIQQGDQIFPATCNYDLESQTVDLKLQNDLTAGEANIVLKFNGPISTKMAGFYRIKYSLKGKTVFGASTQFEAIDARRALPCFDEPDFKAHFQLSIFADPDKTVLSNMEVNSATEQADGRVLHEFGTTPKMSTYLLAFVIGDFEYVEQQSDHGVRIRIYTPVDRSDEGLFALDVAAESLSFYENFFDLRYPLPKLDLVSIPDFSSGAMENWGLVTFRETTILVNQKLSSARTKYIVTLVVAHELAHMWFGNLVTMGWWTDLWLNEGFATFMEYLCSTRCYPDYQFDTMFLTAEFMNSLVVDALENTHPVEVPIDDPSRIDEIFDDISYSKGSSVIAMLFHLIGETNFRACLKSYLTQYAYKNTETKDLWAAFANCGYDVEGIMNTFTLQSGYPVVKVSCDSTEDGGVIMVLEQNRFTFMSRESDSSLWKIPIGYCSENDSGNVTYVVLNQRKDQFPLDDVIESNWIKVNAGVHGFFRVQYSASLFAKLLEGIDTLPLNDKMSLLDDTFALGFSGYIDLEMAFNLTDVLKDNFNTYIWGVISQSINDVMRIVVGSPVEKKFRAYVQSMLMSGIYEHVGWEVKPDEDPKMSLLRSMVFGMMANYGGDEFHYQCQHIFPKMINNDASTPIVDPNIVLAIYQSVMSFATFKELGDLLKYYDTIERSEAKTIIIQAIGCLKCPGAVSKIFDILTSGKIRSQDIMYLLRGLRTHAENSAEFWKLYKQNYDFFLKSVQTSCLCGSIKCVSYFFSTDEQLKDFKAFFAGKSVGIERTIAQCAEEIGERKLRIERHLPALETYFN